MTTPVLKARKESLMFVSTDVRQKGSPLYVAITLIIRDRKMVITFHSTSAECWDASDVLMLNIFAITMQ